MNNIIRNVLSIMAGTFVAVVLIALVQAFSHQMYPPPPGTDFSDPEVLAELMMNAPLGALVMVLVSYSKRTTFCMSGGGCQELLDRGLCARCGGEVYFL